MKNQATICIALATLASSATAQHAPAVLKLDDGRQIYISGLRRWTVAMIQDSLGKYSPGDSLQSHACAAVLRYKLNFADAAAITIMGGSRPNIIFVDVREPQDSARVHYRTIPFDSISPRREWLAITSVMRDSSGLFYDGVTAFMNGSNVSALNAASTRVHDFFQARRSNHDWLTATEVMAKSPNWRDRSVAALILTNFPDSTQTWATLMDGMLESDGAVKSTSWQSLQRVARTARRSPDWTTLAPTVHAILDGTSLFQLSSLISLLGQRPDIGPQYASSFLKGGGEMLVNYMQNPQPARAAPARALLVKLHGSDLGKDAGAWERWISTLR